MTASEAMSSPPLHDVAKQFIGGFEPVLPPLLAGLLQQQAHLAHGPVSPFASLTASRTQPGSNDFLEVPDTPGPTLLAQWAKAKDETGPR